MGYGWGWSWGMGFGMLVMALFWVFVIVAAVWLVTTLTRPRQAGDADRRAGAPAAVSILGERLARGEIDVEEFRARKTALEEGRR
jgi:putative membrane protein